MTQSFLSVLSSALQKRRHLVSVAIYGAANMLPQLTAAILAIAYTYTFSPKWYGVYGVLTALMAILGNFADLSLPQAILRNYYDRHDDAPEARRYLASVLFGSRLLSLLVLPAIGAILYLFWRTVGVGLPIYIFFLLAIAFFDRASAMLGTICRAMEKPLFYSAGVIAYSAATLGGAFVLVYLCHFGIVGALLAALAGRIASWLAYFVVVRRKLGVGHGGFDWPELRACLAFGLPLLVNRVANWGRQLALRPVLVQLVPLQAVGMFSFASSLASIPAALSTAVDLALSPIYFKRRVTGSPEFRQKLLQFGTVFSGVMFAVWVVAIVASPWAVGLVARSKYAHAAPACAILLCAAYVRIHFPFFARQVQFLRVTWLIPSVTVPCAVLSVTMTILLAGTMGIMAAAWAALTADLVLLIALAVAISLYEQLDYPIVIVTLLVALLLALSIWVAQGEPVPAQWSRLAVGGVLSLTAILAVLVTIVWPNRALIQDLAGG